MIDWPRRSAPARGRFFFLIPMTETTSTSTTGSSVLPTITPELLWFESYVHGAPRCAVTLPDGAVAFAHRGAVHAMPEAEWRQFLAYRRLPA